jgi:hypothetical protein
MAYCDKLMGEKWLDTAFDISWGKAWGSSQKKKT